MFGIQASPDFANNYRTTVESNLPSKNFSIEDMLTSFSPEHFAGSF